MLWRGGHCFPHRLQAELRATQEGSFTGADGSTSTMMTSVDADGKITINGPFPKDQTKTLTETHTLSADGTELTTTMRLQDAKGAKLAFVTRVLTRSAA